MLPGTAAMSTPTTAEISATKPTGTFVVADEVPALVLGDRLVPWSAAGYCAPMERPERGDATVLTPPSTVEVLRNGYRPVLHATAI